VQEKRQEKAEIKEVKQEVVPYNPLRPERINVKFIPREDGYIDNPKHLLYGGMMEGSVRRYGVPIIGSTGAYKNVLTNNEKAFLEKAMGLEDGALSVYKKENNYWDGYSVRLVKGDNYLNLADPADYIKLKVLLVNKDFICESPEMLRNYPLPTY